MIAGVAGSTTIDNLVTKEHCIAYRRIPWNNRFRVRQRLWLVVLTLPRWSFSERVSWCVSWQLCQPPLDFSQPTLSCAGTRAWWCRTKQEKSCERCVDFDHRPGRCAGVTKSSRDRCLNGDGAVCRTTCRRCDRRSHPCGKRPHQVAHLRVSHFSNCF